MKKIISFLMTLLMILSSVQITSAAETADMVISDTFNEQNAGWLKSLGISVDLKSDTATRGEFLVALIKMMNMDKVSATQLRFTDVDRDSELGSALEAAINLGIVSDADMFEPDRAITYYEACKMAVCALGYDVNAKVLGGYPNGYVSVASKFDLTYGRENGTFGKGDFIEFLTLLSHTYIRDINSITSDNGELHVNFETGKRFIEKYRNYRGFEGVVEANEITHLYFASKKCPENKVVIGEITYNANMKDYKLGTYVYGYTDLDGNIIYSWSDENDITVIKSTQSPKYVNGYLYYYDNNTDKEKKVAIPHGAATLINGQAGIMRASDYSLVDGYIELINNNGDSSVDVVSVYKSEFIEVSGFSATDEFIRGTNDGAKISLANKKYDFSGVEFSQLEKNMILEYFKSPDGMYYEFYLCDEVSGNVTMLGSAGSKLVYIDDVEYETAAYFNKWYKELVTIGSDIKATVSLDGKLISANIISQSTLKYGYYYDCKYNDKGMDKAYLIKLYSEDGEVQTYRLSDKVVFNGTPQSAEVVYGEMLSEKESLIRYHAKDDKIIKIITDNGNGDFYNPSSDGIDILKRYHYMGYNSTTDKIPYVTGYFVPFFFIGGDTVIFAVKSAEKESDENKRFSVGTGSSFLGGMNDPIKNQLLAYNVTKEGYAGAIVYNDDGSRDTYLGTLSAPHAIVTGATKTLDSEGEEKYCISLYWGDGYFDLYIDPDAEFINESGFREGYAAGEIPFTSGDYIRYNSSGDTLIYANRAFDAKNNILRAVQKYHDSELNFYYGNLTGVSDAGCSLLITQDDNHIGGEFYYPVPSTITVVKSNGYVFNRPATELAGYVDNPNCKGVLVSCSQSKTTTIVVYE